MSPDSAPSSGTSDTPVGASDFTVPGTWDRSSRTVSENKTKNINQVWLYSDILCGMVCVVSVFTSLSIVSSYV